MEVVCESKEFKICKNGEKYHVFVDDRNVVCFDDFNVAVLFVQTWLNTNEIKRLKRVIGLWFVTACFFATWVGILTVNMVM